MRRWLFVPLGLLLAATALVRADERLDQTAFWKIRQEGTNNSRIMQTLHVLTDVYGPRLTGSPNLKAAGEWAVGQMQAWGLKNGRLEPWDFGHPGWSNERMAVHLVSPVKDALVAEVLAWTPSTSGIARAAAVQIAVPVNPTQDEFAAYLGTIKNTVNGRMVLVGAPRQVPVTFSPPALRRDDSDVLAQLVDDPLAAPAGTPPVAAAPVVGDAQPKRLSAAEVDDQLNLFLVASGAVVRVNDAGREGGQIRAFNNRTFDTAKAPPTLVMRNEDYGRISRLLADRRTVELEVEILNRSFLEGRTAYNSVAEIPGGDRADEVVMLGAHLDSWHAATGATDNAIGSSIMMEAARIIVASGLRPRRTIRVALWSGEEQGLLGSQAYVREHFGSAEAPKAEFKTFDGYFNIDSGTGLARGMNVFGPPAASMVLREVAAVFRDLGLLGARATRSRVRGGTDSTSFNDAGLPGIGMLQDPIQYQTETWHTNLDTYERIVEDDVKKAAIVVAAAVYHLAMRDEMLPRFSPDQMPQRPPNQVPAPSAPAATAAAPARTN